MPVFRPGPTTSARRPHSACRARAHTSTRSGTTHERMASAGRHAPPAAAASPFPAPLRRASASRKPVTTRRASSDVQPLRRGGLPRCHELPAVEQPQPRDGVSHVDRQQAAGPLAAGRLTRIRSHDVASPSAPRAAVGPRAAPFFPNTAKLTMFTVARPDYTVPVSSVTRLPERGEADIREGAEHASLEGATDPARRRHRVRRLRDHHRGIGLHGPQDGGASLAHHLRRHHLPVLPESPRRTRT